MYVGIFVYTRSAKKYLNYKLKFPFRLFLAAFTSLNLNQCLDSDDFVSLHGADGQINDPEYEQNRCVYPLGGRGSSQLGFDVRIQASVHHNEYGDHCLATEKRHSEANAKER